MKVRLKKGIAVFLTAMMVLAMAFQSIAAPLSSMNPAAASEPAKITGTWSTDASGSWRFNAPDGAAKDGWYYLNTTNNATDYNWFCFDANGVMRTGWVQDKNDPSVWYYTGESKDSSEGGLVKGWITDPQDGKKYYLDPSTGIMCHGWKRISNVWYYFGEKQYSNASHPYGAMYVNEKTPDGYYVGSNGGWIQNYSENDSDDPDPAPKSYTVTFNMQGHGTQIAPIKNVLSGAKITAPTAPTAEGYEFVCWCKEPECATPWNFDIDTVTKDTTIYANWRQNPAPVTVADILPGDFPTTEAAAWKNPENVKCYRTQSATLFFKTTYYEQVQLSQPVTAVGSNWETGIGQGGKITFEMENSKLMSIVVSRLAGDFRKINGSYVAPEPVVPVTGVSLDKSEVTLGVGDTCTLSAAVAPANATNKKVTWSSSDSSIAAVDAAGKVTAAAAGTAIITVTTVDSGKTATCTVTVTPAPETKTIVDILDTVSGGFPGMQNAWEAETGYRCFINDTSSELRFRDTSGAGYDIDVSKPVTKDGDNYVYEANWGKISFTMDSDSLISITWYSSDSSLKDYNGTYAPVVHVTGVSLNETTITLSVDGNQKLTAAVVPDNATDKAVTWSSSNESVAKVNNNGTVTAIAAGTAIITVTTVDGGKTATCEVTVTEEPATTYTVIYHANGATSGTAPDAQTKVKDEDLKLATNTGNLEKTGYSFAGWNTAFDGSGKHYDAGATYTENVGITLYAEWDSQCIAAGTMISMPGGKQKAVEELEIGDIICTFDHETGEVSSAPVCFIWESKNVGNAFTLTFEGDIEVTVIEEHGFYDQEEQKYVFINLQNAQEYIGDHFYHADSNNWLELKSCKVSNERVDAYAIITSGNLNHMSNGMLSMCDGTVKMIANIFEYDDRMRFDADKKKADIEKYGLTPIEKILEFDGFIEADYVDYNLQYLNVAIGKGLTTWERIKAVSDYCVANGLVCIEQTNDVPMLGTEEKEPVIKALDPRSKPESCEPEKFEEAKPEELIEPAEAVAEKPIEDTEPDTPETTD